MSILGQPYSHPRLSASETFQPEGSLQLYSGRLLLHRVIHFLAHVGFLVYQPGILPLQGRILLLLLAAGRTKYIIIPRHYIPTSIGWRAKARPRYVFECREIGKNEKRKSRNYNYWNQSAHLETIPTASYTTKCHSAENSFFRSWLSSLTFPEIPNGTE